MAFLRRAELEMPLAPLLDGMEGVHSRASYHFADCTGARSPCQATLRISPSMGFRIERRKFPLRPWLWRLQTHNQCMPNPPLQVHLADSEAENTPWRKASTVTMGFLLIHGAVAHILSQSLALVFASSSVGALFFSSPLSLL